jgi:alkylated DNA repair protein (DNA oxidative demethylase)
MRRVHKEMFDAPVGFEYWPEVISRLEADYLAEKLLPLPLAPHAIRGRLTKRKMHNFGWHYDAQRRASQAVLEAIPGWLITLRDKCAELTKTPAEDYVQATVTLYEKGAAIGAHIDAPIYGPCILGISLLTSVELELWKREVRYYRPTHK